LLSQSGEVGRASLSRLSTDPLVCGLLVLYGIHPVSLEERVSRSLDGLRGQLEKQGASAELVSVRDGAARVKLQVSGGPWSPEKLKASVQQAILEVAPELAEVILEGVPSPNFIPINMLQLERTEEKNYEESAT
jgi:Fe-S cluster biogenesis protein NfuA